MLAQSLFAIPLIYLIYQWTMLVMGQPHELGFNPQEATHHMTGQWALRCLLLTLCISPLSKWKRVRKVMLFRRMAGLWAFAYVVVHIISYLWLEKFFDWQEIGADIIKRPYITVGMITFITLLPLAITSTKGWVKRLGALRWRALHRLMYLAVVLAPLHFIMMRKGWQLEPRIYALIALCLIAVRIISRLRRQS